jgi:drug/metabolite transporter (DMT)-like permease
MRIVEPVDEQAPAGAGTMVAGPRRDPLRGALIMLVGMALFSILNGVVKAQAQHFPVNQIVFFRNAGGVVPLLLVLLLSGRISDLRTRDPLRHVVMAISMTGGLFFSFTAFHLMPLADVMAIGFTQPILVTLASALLLRERIPPAGWIAVLGGLAGVQLMVQPSGAGFNIGAVAAVFGTICSATSMMLQRNLASREDPLVITAWYMGLSSLALAPTLGFSWVSPSPLALAGLIAMGLASGLCQWLTMQALYHATAAAIAPINYTNMLWAIIIGYFWFGDVPTLPVLAGLAIVIAATGVLIHAARRARAEPRRGAGEARP